MYKALGSIPSITKKKKNKNKKMVKKISGINVTSAIS
jgi:hypothetical protein